MLVTTLAFSELTSGPKRRPRFVCHGLDALWAGVVVNLRFLECIMALPVDTLGRMQTFRSHTETVCHA